MLTTYYFRLSSVSASYPSAAWFPVGKLQTHVSPDKVVHDFPPRLFYVHEIAFHLLQIIELGIKNILPDFSFSCYQTFSLQPRSTPFKVMLETTFGTIRNFIAHDSVAAFQMPKSPKPEASWAEKAAAPELESPLTRLVLPAYTFYRCVLGIKSSPTFAFDPIRGEYQQKPIKKSKQVRKKQ